jgi:nitrogen fixation protein
MYQGRAKLHQARSKVKHDLEEAIILVEQNETRRYAGLVLEGTRSLCGHVCHNTQIPDVVACLETKDPNRDWKFLKAIDHETVNLLTHMHFTRFEEFQEAVCQVERKGLFNKLQALASGNKYALHDI